MNKLRITLIAIFASVMMIVSSTAEVRVGVSAGYAQFEATGSETLKDAATVVNHTEQAIAVIPSIFAEIAMANGLGLGVDVVSGSADLAGSKRTRNLKADAGTGANDTGTNVANAEVDGVTTGYLIKTFDSGFLVKAGIASADINTVEVLSTGSTYGNKSVDGTMIGIGWGRTMDTGLFFRAAVEYTDFDEITLTSGVADAVSDTTNTIKADVDVTMAKFSIGKAF